ncbi:carbonic anhydrase family protein [Anabaena sp. UHCC 0399]|uniref:carbonic anhydrase n=1 Tax=Anabaena sp. UHCC 0399 TaxID=3110238 RepID=UPI002B1EC817|nr:carbonic anhydrase family protein [Anabaena sp. UHCC 0399]MEA5567222.1 carbonic anhydrase family protein [Anabaena sp. UHCC 0399]
MNLINKKWCKNILVFVTFFIGLITIPSVQTFAGEGTPDWGYGGAANPTQWAQISHDFALCELGRDQSPINLVSAIKEKLQPIFFNYKPTPLVVVNNGHTLQVNYAPGSTITINGEKYTLLQFHFHTPSEHTIGGKAAAMELHLVHRNDAGQLSVVGIMMKEGAANRLINEIWQYIPAVGETKTVSRTINAAAFLPNTKAYFSYPGSLTTPPCSEGVRWNVLVEPITVSKEEISIFQKLYQVNARPIQPVNGRVIELHSK